VGFACGWYFNHSKDKAHPVTIMHVLPQPQEVILSSNKGKQVILSEQHADTLRIAGAQLENNHTITYSQSALLDEAIEIHTLQTPRCKDFQITLPDGTMVWLNAESTLRYPSRFSDKERIVELTGEAYFQVKKDSIHPFIVRTQHLTTQVLGTRFNFRSYGHEPCHVTLIEGKVAISRPGHTESQTLKSGQNACLTDEGTIQVKQVNTLPFTAWTEGYFYFEDIKLYQIMKELGRWYNLTIRFEKPQSMDHRFNFWADRRAPVETTLEQLNLLGKVLATLEGNTITIR